MWTLSSNQIIITFYSYSDLKVLTRRTITATCRTAIATLLAVKKRPQRGFTDPLHISVDQITTKPNRDLKQKTIRDHRVDYTPARISNCLECGTVVVIAANDSWKTLTSMIIPQLMSETSYKIFKVIWTVQYLNWFLCDSKDLIKVSTNILKLTKIA